MKTSAGSVTRLFGLVRKAASEEKENIEHELPFVVMIFTLMAASGVSLYDSWKRIRKLTFLPTFKKEADEVVRQVEVLGKDPLTVMHSRAEKTNSKLYRNFLGGFISSMRSGGKIVDFMRSELKSIFELRNIAMTRSIEKIATLVETYAVMLIVTLCAYILVVVFSATSMLDIIASTSIPNSPILSYLIAFLFMPMISVIFILVAHNMQRSPFISLDDLYRKALILGLAIGIPLCIIMLVPSLPFITGTIGLAELVTIGLIAISVPPAIQYYRISKINYNSEEAIPSFIRDVTESQKIGLSPEKSIIQATTRKFYGQFSQFLELITKPNRMGHSPQKNIRKHSSENQKLVHHCKLCHDD